MATFHLNFDAATDGNGSVGSQWKLFASAQAGIAKGDTVMVSGYLGDAMVFDRAKGGLTPATKTRWLGTLANPFVVSGGEKLTGWEQCAPGRLGDIGPQYPSVFEKTVTKSSLLGSEPYSANICENNVQLPICTERAITTDAFFLTRPHYYHVASAVTTSGVTPSIQLLTMSLPAVTDLFTKVQLERAALRWVTEPNAAAFSPITYDTVTKVMTLLRPDRYENNSFNNSFALANLLPSIKRGEWGFIDNGTTVTFFLWPKSVASLAGGIEYSARSVGININGTNNLEIGFFKTRQTAGRIGASGNLFNFGVDCSDVYLHNFESTDTYAYNEVLTVPGEMQAAVYINGVANCELAYFDVRRAQNCFGIFSQGSGAETGQRNGTPETIKMMSGGFCHHYTCAFCSAAGHRLFTVSNHINAFAIFWECARRSHGNKMNAYQSSYNHLWWGIDAQDADGYFTYQESDSIVMAFCSSSASTAPSGDARGIVQQNRVHFNMGSVYGFKGGACFNNSITPNGLDGRLSATNSLFWGSGAVPLDRQLFVGNNLMHGSSAYKTADLATIDEFDHNVTTNGVTRGPNDVLVTLAETYVNAAINDFRIMPNSIVRTKPGKNITTLIAGLKTRFLKMPDAWWSLDMVEAAMNPASPGIGPTVNKDALRGKARNITYAGIAGGSSGGGGGAPSRPVINPNFKIRKAA